MAQPHLRIYFGPDGGKASEAPPEGCGHTVRVPLGEVFNWLSDAIVNGRTWLQDFEDDEVTISSDLYDVILAYQHYRRPTA